MITTKPFGKTQDGKAVLAYTITAPGGASAVLLDYGATLQALFVPDRAGALADVTVGFDTLAVYADPAVCSYQGMSVGRYANRIAGGRFVIDGKVYTVTRNEEGRTCLHGGGEFSHTVWAAEVQGEDTVCFSYTSKDGSEGFPGEVQAKIQYTLSPDNTLTISYFAVSDQKTVLNLTNHTYFNLTGNHKQDVLQHELQIAASAYTPIDAQSIPLGAHQAVAGTAFDFRAAKPIGQDIAAKDVQLQQCRGYDHNFCLDSRSADVPAAEVYEPQSGRVLRVFTDLPGVQLYTGNFLKGEIGKGGVAMQPHSGFCLETQYFPNTPNMPAYPQCTFAAGEEFVSTTRFQFCCR